MNQVVRALEAFLNQRVAVKRADKMQYTRMGKREDDNMDEMKDLGMRMFLNNDDMDEVEDKMMKWGLLGKRENDSNKIQVTRMGKRDGMDKMQYTRMGKRENGKMHNTRMGKRNTGGDKDLLVNEKE